jgi:hypothetical protein
LIQATECEAAHDLARSLIALLAAVRERQSPTAEMCQEAEDALAAWEDSFPTNAHMNSCSLVLTNPPSSLSAYRVHGRVEIGSGWKCR